MAPTITASPIEGVSTPNIPTPTTPSNVKRQDSSAVKHAMTTPYVFPSACTLSYTMTSCQMPLARIVGKNGFGLVQEEFLWIDIDHNPLWQTCQPTGMTKGYVVHNPSDVYRGAVCPEGWIAFNVGLASQEGVYTEATQTWSTAKCCKSGDDLGENIWQLNYEGERDVRHFGDVCISTSTAPFNGLKPPSTMVFPSYTVDYYATQSYLTDYTIYRITLDENSSTSTFETVIGTEYPEGRFTTLKPFIAGRAFYPPLSMEWLEEDNKTLNPTWPTLTSDMLVPTWPIGEWEYGKDPLGDGVFDNRGKGRTAEVNTEASMPNKVAIPVISILAVLLAAALAGIAFLLWKGKRGGSRPILKAKNSSSEVPMQKGDDAASTAQSGGRPRTGNDNGLRER